MSTSRKRQSQQISQAEEEISPKLIADAVKTILTLDASKRPIKQSDVWNVSNIKLRRKLQTELWKLVRVDLAKMGMILTDCDVGLYKGFVLTKNGPDHAFMRNYATKEERADRTLLVLILAYIFMKDGVATEDEIFRHLSNLGIPVDGSSHEYFGDAAKKIQGKFLDQTYLQKTSIPEQEIIEMRWGLRARLEVPPMLILKFVCDVAYQGKVDPTHWAAQYERARGEVNDE